MGGGYQTQAKVGCASGASHERHVQRTGALHRRGRPFAGKREACYNGSGFRGEPPGPKLPNEPPDRPRGRRFPGSGSLPCCFSWAPGASRAHAWEKC